MLQVSSRYAYLCPPDHNTAGRAGRVHDLERGQDVLLCRAPDAMTAPTGFERAYFALATVRHPSLARALDYGRDAQGVAYYTVEASPGEDLDALPAPLAIAEAATLLPGLVGALDLLHARGFRLPALAPGSVKLAPAARAVLVHPGEVSELAPDAPREDLRGLGRLLYRALTGQAPQAGAAGTIVPARQVRADLPADWEAALAKLLSVRARDGFASGRELLAALGLAQESVLFAPPLVERDVLLGELETFAREPGAAAVWLSGPAGAGKSRLLAELKPRLELAGLSVAWLAGTGTDAPAYEAIRSALRGWIAIAGDALPQASRERLRSWLEGDRPVGWLDSAQERLALHGAAVEAALAANQGRIWLVDDADRLDPASRELLEALFHAGLAPGWRWIRTATEVPAGVQALALPRLSPAGLTALAAGCLGGAGVPGPTGAALDPLSQGLPGRAIELLAHWRDAGALVFGPVGWEPSPGLQLPLPAVALPAGGSLGRLSPGARRLGALVALWGDRAERTDLEALADDAALLDELVRTGVIALEGSHYRLAGGDTRLALVASLGAPERRDLHARCFALAARGEPDPARGLAPLLPAARHGAAAGIWPAARPWVLAAARAAMALHEVDVAWTLLQSLGGSPATAREADDEALLRVHVLRNRGDVAAARALLDGPLLDRLLARDDAEGPDHLTTAGVLAQLAGDYDTAAKRYGEAAKRAERQALPLAGIRARLFAGRTAYFRGEIALAGEHFAGALALADDPAGGSFRGWALGLYGHWQAMQPDGAATGIAMLHEAVSLNRARGQLYMAHEALNNLGDVLLARGRATEARAAFAECLQLAERFGLRNERVFALANLAGVALVTGEWSEAAVHARRALAESRRQGRRYPEGLALALLGLAEVHLGQLEVGRERLTEALALARAIGHRALELVARAHLAEALLELGRWEAAETELAGARALAAESGLADQDERLERVSLALAVLAAHAEADEATARAVERAEESASATGSSAWLWRGACLAAVQRHDEAIAALQRARALAGPQGLVAVTSTADFLQGSLMASADLLERASAAARAVGHAALEAAVEARLGRLALDERPRKLEAARRLRELAGTLADDDRAAYLAHPWRAPAMVADAEGTAFALRPLAELSRRDDLGRLMRQALLTVVEAVQAERGVLLLYDGLAIAEAIACGAQADGLDGAIAALAHRVHFTGEAVFVADATAQAALGLPPTTRSVAAIPLRQGGEALGVMIADSRRPMPMPSERERALLEALGRHVAAAIAAARRMTTTDQNFEDLSAVHALALAAMGQPTDTDARRLLLREGLVRAGARRGYLLAGPGLARVEALDDAGRTVAGAMPGRTLCEWAYRHDQPVTAPLDPTLWDEPAVAALRPEGAFWAVPLRANGSCQGILAVVREGPGAAPLAVQPFLLRLGELLGALLARDLGASRIDKAI